MSLDPWSRTLKIWESIGTPTPKVWAHLGVWRFIPSHSPTLSRAWNVTLELPSWPTPLHALALVVGPRSGLQQPLCIKTSMITHIKLFINPPLVTCSKKSKLITEFNIAKHKHVLKSMIGYQLLWLHCMSM
jgi:hypothetical protein